MTSPREALRGNNARQHLHHQSTVNLRVVKLVLALAIIPSLRASPISNSLFSTSDHGEDATQGPSKWLYLTTAVVLVLLGGAFAGLTIALMGQDEIYLQVIASSGDGAEKAHAQKVLNLVKKGKHWVLVTLLLSNVITNETLPIVLDRSLGGGWPAILSSTVLIVIFGEIAPQSICVRYGLPIGAWMAPFVLVLMWVMAPVAWPVARLLDYLLGEDHGTTYKKAGLKTLVTLHKTMGTSPDERLNQDEVTIISAVLDLKEKSVGSIMTPMEDAFTLSSDTVLDEEMMDDILSAGYSRIPIHSPDNDMNFVGMLLVKMLITYDPEDAKRVNEFALATLPETRPETSCLDIVNFFQEGKSHMVLVSDFPGESYGTLGVVTLEDVIEELIGEEIIDESDVYVDVHKAIRRMAPAPRNRVPKGKIVPDSEHPDDTYLKDVNGSTDKMGKEKQSLSRSVSTNDAMKHSRAQNNASKMKDHFKHLGPSNLASKPRQTRYANFKIKPGVAPETEARPLRQTKSYYDNPPRMASRQNSELSGDAALASAGKNASDAVREVRQGYGTMDRPWTSERRNTDSGDAVNNANKSAETDGQASQEDGHDENLLRPTRTRQSDHQSRSPASQSQSPTRQRAARSGSIMEHTLDAGGIKKIVLEPNDSDKDKSEGDSNEGSGDGSADNTNGEAGPSKQKENVASESSSKKNKRSRKKKKHGKSGDESIVPLLENHD